MKLPIKDDTGGFLNCRKYKEMGLKRKELTIKSFEEVDIKDKRKVIIRFQEIENTFVLNQTNMKILQRAYGDETENMINKKVYINVIPSQFNGQPTETLVLDCA